MMLAIVAAIVFGIAPPVSRAHAARCPVDTLDGWLVCQEVALAAELSGVPVRLATVLAWSESRFRAGAVSTAGCVGPLQVAPRYWCPGGVPDGCDLVMAGTMALRELTDRFGLEGGLCRYAAGNSCNDRSLRYARFIIDRADL
jgi:soluble lytic murein transglycosylase-like protein